MIASVKVSWNKLTKPTVVTLNDKRGTASEAPPESAEKVISDAAQGDIKLLAIPFEVMRLHNGEWYWADNRGTVDGDVVDCLNLMRGLGGSLMWPKQLVNLKLSHGDIKVHPRAREIVTTAYRQAEEVDKFLAEETAKLADGRVPSILPVVFDCPPGTLMTGTFLREIW